MLTELIKTLENKKNAPKAKILAKFFKTGKGEYGEGDIFWGIAVPTQRAIAKKFSAISLNEITKLLKNPIHECRLTTLFILNQQFLKANKKTQEKIFNICLKNTKHINNWDLVDSSAPQIIGGYLINQDRKILYRLAQSKNLWEKRISVLATFAFIKNNDFIDTLKISEILLKDEHDLIHKAVGWMLREIGKKDLLTEEKFLNKYYRQMPRTMLRYAIEKFSEDKKKFYLSLKK